jgi:nitroimidazol reductase NimA-like FMN-containing flavoprotein (pyridoxamine 5'-phosphate oxidase superfamily)
MGQLESSTAAPLTGGPSDRIRVRRNPKKGRDEPHSIEAILDRAMVAHVAFVDRGEPVCIPMLYARVGQKIYLHGSRASRAMRRLAEGERACFTVTVLDGLVLARSAFEHSANYESVVVFGRFQEVAGDGERLAALAAFTDKLLPGRWREVRPPNAKELKATMVLAMELADASGKVRSGPPDDDDTQDAALDVWAGEVPISHCFQTPIASPGLRDGVPISASVRRLCAAQTSTGAAAQRR